MYALTLGDPNMAMLVRPVDVGYTQQLCARKGGASSRLPMQCSPPKFQDLHVVARKSCK